MVSATVVRRLVCSLARACSGSMSGKFSIAALMPEHTPNRSADRKAFTEHHGTARGVGAGLEEKSAFGRGLSTQ